VVLRGPALELLPLLEPDDAINAIGHVEPVSDGLAVVVDEPGGIIQAGDPVPQVPDELSIATGGSGSVTATLGSAGSEPAARGAGVLDGSSGIDSLLAGVAGLGTLICLSLASLLVTLGRRAHARRQLSARVAARVAAFEGSAGPYPAPPPGPRSAERDDSTIHAA
jgi:hypothetical protein